MLFASSDPPDSISITPAKNAVWVERLLWVFLMAFAFDYRGAVDRAGTGGASIDQLFFLSCSIFSTMGIFFLGWRYLAVRPGVWMIAFWGIFLTYMMANSVLQGVQIGRAVRVALPLAFCLFSMVNSHIAGCMGIRPSRIVNPVFCAACINIVWRIVEGFVFKGASLETVRLEVLSPANNWLAAWIGCAVLLRGRFHWNVLLGCGILFMGVFITITRSLIFPILTSGLACCICFVVGAKWGIFQWSSIGKRLLPIGAALLLVIAALGAVALFQPLLLERWNERLFHNAATQNLGADISYLTRKAEADAIWTILNKDPVHFINGRGIGSSYYWDHAYMPEIWMIIPKEETELDDIWSAGHSVWTYGLLSGGVIALLSFVSLLIGTATLSMKAARANATDSGPDQWLAFLPFVAVCCLVSESMTSNPFQERLVGIFFGIMVGLPQAFMVRASWIHTSTRL